MVKEIMDSRLTRLKLSNGGDYEFELSNDMSASLLPEKTFLYILFRGRRLSYLSVPISSLLYGSMGGRLEADTVSEKSYKACFGMTCVRWNCWVYLIGGLDPEKSDALDCSDESQNVFRLAVVPPVLLGYPDNCERSPMHSEKGRFSVAVEHNDILYVLSAFFVERLPRYTFECYNAKEDIWYALARPPFHNFPSRYCENIGCLSYIAKDNKICVSTQYYAFAYDVDAKEWGPCYLFEGFSRPWKCETRSYTSNETKSGPPFGFQGEGVFYGDDCLIGMMNIKGLVVGYRINCGRVVGKQQLCDLPETCDEYSNFGSLVDMGNGYFSVTYTKLLKDSMKVVVVTFKVSRLMEISHDRFLEYNFCSKHEFEVDDDDWFSPYSFAV